MTSRKFISRPLRDLVLPYEVVDPKKSPDAVFRYIDIGSIDNESKQITEPKQFLGGDAPSRARRVVKTGDVLFSTVRPYLKNIAVVPAEMDGHLTSTGICVLRPGPDIDGRFLFHAVCRDEFVRSLSHSMDGSLYPAVRDSDILDMLVTVPSLEEQRRIVTRIEEMMERSRRAGDALNSIPDDLNRLENSFLQQVFTGEMTATWRGTHLGVESAPELLKRMGREALPGEVPYYLPETWAWATLGSVTHLKGGIQKGKKRNGTETLVEVPYLRVANVQRGHLDLTEILTIPVTQAELHALRLQPGDVLLNEGGDRDKLGRGWVWEGQIDDCIHQNHVFRARPIPKLLHPKLISWYANIFGQEFFFQEGKQTTNLASISMSVVSALPVPVMPWDEQLVLVEIIEEFYARQARLRTMCGLEDDLAQMEASFLQKAFSGEL